MDKFDEQDSDQMFDISPPKIEFVVENTFITIKDPVVNKMKKSKSWAHLIRDVPECKSLHRDQPLQPFDIDGNASNTSRTPLDKNLPSGKRIVFKSAARFKSMPCTLDAKDSLGANVVCKPWYKIGDVAKACETGDKFGNTPEACGDVYKFDNETAEVKRSILFDHKPKKPPPKKYMSVKLQGPTLSALNSGMPTGLPSLQIPKLKSHNGNCGAF